jgi:hypothetical protein
VADRIAPLSGIHPCHANSSDAGSCQVPWQPAGPQFVTVEDSMSVAHASRGTLPPASPRLHSEVRIACE